MPSYTCGIEALTLPETTTGAYQRTLAQALSLAGAGDTVYLATSGVNGHYVGNWSVNTTATSATAPLTIEPVARRVNPTLDGNGATAGVAPEGWRPGQVLCMVKRVSPV